MLWLQQQLQLNRQSIIKYSCICLGCQLFILLLTSYFLLHPAWIHYRQVRLQSQQQLEQKKICVQQTHMQHRLQQQLTQLSKQHLSSPIAFDQQIEKQHWQGRLLQWLKQHHIQVTQFETNEKIGDNTVEIYQLVAHCDWSAFVMFFNRLQVIMPFLNVMQIQVSSDTQQPLIQFTADIKVNHE